LFDHFHSNQLFKRENDISLSFQSKKKERKKNRVLAQEIPFP